MSSLIFMLMLQSATTQFMISTKAGLVNYVQGTATVKPATSVKPGEIVKTGPGGAVELLLNPGSYLRMGENTRVTLDRVELYDIAVRILDGSMVIASNGFNKDLPLHVASGNLEMEIIKDGIYLFADGKVVVVDGKIAMPETASSTASLIRSPTIRDIGLRRSRRLRRASNCGARSATKKSRAPTCRLPAACGKYPTPPFRLCWTSGSGIPLSALSTCRAGATALLTVTDTNRPGKFTPAAFPILPADSEGETAPRTPVMAAGRTTIQAKAEAAAKVSASAAPGRRPLPAPHRPHPAGAPKPRRLRAETNNSASDDRAAIARVSGRRKNSSSAEFFLHPETLTS